MAPTAGTTTPSMEGEPRAAPGVVEALLSDRPPWPLTCVQVTWDPAEMQTRLSMSRWGLRFCVSSSSLLVPGWSSYEATKLLKPESSH